MAFGYLKDPLFNACFCAYWVNFLLEYWGFSFPILRCYLNDVVCIPFWVPIMLWVHRQLGLRKGDQPPESFEIVMPLVTLAIMFEVVLPFRVDWGVPAVADPYDVLCYCLGGVGAALFWKWHYRAGSLGSFAMIGVRKESVRRYEQLHLEERRTCSRAVERSL